MPTMLNGHSLWLGYQGKSNEIEENIISKNPSYLVSTPKTQTQRDYKDASAITYFNVDVELGAYLWKQCQD